MVIKKAKDTLFIMGNKRMIPVLFILMYRGIVLSYYSSVLVSLSLNQLTESLEPTKKTQKGVFLMIFFGIAEVTGAIASGRLIKILGKRFGVCLLIILGVLAIVEMPVLVYSKVPYGWPYYVEAALWGFADSSLNTSIIGLLVIYI